LTKDFWKKSAIGLLSALLLYAVFAGGNVLSRLVFPFAETGIARVYGFKTGASVMRIALLMILVIGPGEELFWRGVLQRLWMKRFGPIPGYLAATLLYSLVHLASGNVMLVLAAGHCALFWGYLYLRYRSVLLIAVSHTVWDLMIFLIWPLV
jgi:membrane protease YdiL (CAAX protease family)